MSDPDKKNFHAKVTTETHDQWHDFAADQGVSVTALVEALAPNLTDGNPLLAPVIGNARKLDADRRRRAR